MAESKLMTGSSGNRIPDAGSCAQRQLDSEIKCFLQASYFDKNLKHYFI
jgi:hypothetical protein